MVITIIAILIGLLFPAFKGVQDQAKRTQARMNLTQIIIAVTAFYTEYGQYPCDAQTGNDGQTSSLTTTTPIIHSSTFSVVILTTEMFRPITPKPLLSFNRRSRRFGQSQVRHWRERQTHDPVGQLLSRPDG